MLFLQVSKFEDAFRTVGRSVSPINVFLNYAYYFEHDRYDWHLDINNDLEDYNLHHIPSGFPIKLNETVPEVHVTIHAGKHYNKLPNPLLQGYCIAKRYTDGRQPDFCDPFKNVTNFQLFDFLKDKRATQNHFRTWCSPGTGRLDCSQRIETHYQNVKECYNSGWYDLDLQRVAAVEKAAARENIKCPKIFEFN